MEELHEMSQGWLGMGYVSGSGKQGVGIASFNMDEYIDHNHTNAELSLKILREKKCWQHFTNIANFYDDLAKGNDPSLSSTHHKMAWLHFLSGCSVNLIKGTSNVLSGNLTDSSIYLRRTVEAIRYSTFIRENLEKAKVWFEPDGKQAFEKTYYTWLQKSGKRLVEDEFPNSTRIFDHASNYGPHSNAELFSQQHIVSYENNVMDFRAKFHELDSGKRGYHQLLGVFFWHIRAHSGSIDWWLDKSGFVSHLSRQQIDYWRDCRSQLEHDDKNVKELLVSGPLGRELS